MQVLQTFKRDRHTPFQVPVLKIPLNALSERSRSSEICEARKISKVSRSVLRRLKRRRGTRTQSLVRVVSPSLPPPPYPRSCIRRHQLRCVRSSSWQHQCSPRLSLQGATPSRGQGISPEGGCAAADPRLSSLQGATPSRGPSTPSTPNAVSSAIIPKPLNLTLNRKPQTLNPKP